MATTAWSNTVPGSGEVVSSGDDRMVEDRKAVYERMKTGGHFFTNADAIGGGTTEDLDGAHVIGQGPNGGPHIYKSASTTLANAVKLVSYSDTVVDMTGATSVTGPNITTGDDPGHGHSGAIIMRLPGVIATGIQRTTIVLPRLLRINALKWIVGTSPTAAVTFNLFDLGQPAAGTLPYQTTGVTGVLASPTTVNAAADAIYRATVSGSVFKVAAPGGTTYFDLALGNEMILSFAGDTAGMADFTLIILGPKR